MQKKINRAVIFDSETASLAGGIIEVAALEVGFVDGKLQYGNTYSERFNLPPDIQIEYAAAATHNIIPSDLVGCDVYKTAPEFCNADMVIGHNIGFDLRVANMRADYPVCTLALARNRFPKEKHTLAALMYRIHGLNHTIRQRLKSAHNALADVHFCFELLEYIVAEHPEVTSLEALWQFYNESRVPRTMPGTGKHGGKPISQVPPDYRQWYKFKSANPDASVLEAFTKYPFVGSGYGD